MVWAGLIALVAALVCAWFAHRARTHIRAMVGTETLPVAELEQLRQAAVEAAGEGHFRYRCEVVGVARPHADGPLTSQLKEVDCVWHRHRVTHKYWEIRTDNEGNRRRQESTRVVSQHASAQPFRVEDATGAIVIEPGKREVDGAEKILDRFERDTGASTGELRIGSLSLSLPSNSGSIGYQHEEWALAEGRRLYVHGEATDAGGSLRIGAPAEGGVFLISTRSQEELVRSENRKLRGFGAGAVVAAAAGLVLSAVGLLG
ncbi:GIDE domain-containing protein [Streptomyces sp. ACA25]|uniref:GIDE domain-containing protein n=1 Tax=Streptomyces sp. ACA25 TaxID=3022596 RepID=UPI0023073351|nr:GIDE domain-containing protein [Streptomyces sp. ACA25]MDB1087638.1 GIDE domain-containing protein [Streptomyces sp. ACA25]